MLRSHWASYVVVFMASACTLILEIVAGRILAPYIGVSIYTWTSIIGVVLAGISLGNYAGGVLADRAASRQVLGIILSLGGLSSLAVLPLIELVTGFEYPDGVSLLARIVVMTTAIFFLPAFILGMVSPVVVKLTLRDLSQTGGIVGRIYAFSTLGSILGTFLTGFFLISYFGTRMIVLGVGLVLLAMAVVFGGLFQARKPYAAAAVAIIGAVLGGLFYASTSLYAFNSGCVRETDFYCIKVLPLPVEDRVVQQLVLDHLIHSFNDVRDPKYLHYGYMKVYAEMTDYIAREKPAFQALHIGGGGYTLPRYIATVYPEASDTVIEIDPGVTEIAYERMGLEDTSTVKSINADARMVVDELADSGPYDLVIGDAFNDLSVPYHLTTREFNQKLRDVMSPDGVYLLNVIDKLEGGRFLPSMVRTLQSVFPHVYVLSDSESWSSSTPSTYVVAATGAPIEPARLRQVTPQGYDNRVLTRVMPEDRMQEWLAQSDSVLLTDEYAPVDNLLAPLFLQRGG